MVWNLLQREDAPDGDWCGLIEKGVRIEGNLEVPGTFRIDGSVKGNIQSQGRLILAENAVVEGEIHGQQITVGGTFSGKIFAGVRVDIASTGRVQGEIHAACVMIEPGGVLDGFCHVPSAVEGVERIVVPVRPASAGGG